uniref:NADH-ubiquinone oxidoreductase chain 5 n=1 Tax=Mikadonius gracilis TaxID=700435 RepID=A0A0S2MRC4_9CUCU|nr:NADH deshydrogenase subunit 5 [Mikadonius gracilis]
MINISIKWSMIFLVFSLSFFLLSSLFMILDLVYFLELEMLSINSSLIVFTLLIDWMSLMFMSFVLFISCMVIFYSKEYMYGDFFLERFILLVLMFVLSMMLLIISPNLISILLGWDGLGLVSYCLVIYYQNMKSYSAGMLTALSNRVGDVALLMSIAWMLNYGSWNYIFYLDAFKTDSYMCMISMLVILASMTKSAQIPFSSWLPAAMAAPTPVSSLVHSSTLVTAGVYLMIRFNFSFSESMMYFLLFISSLTMFMSGLGANFEFDLKKIIALSTLSQLGLMMSILALGGYKLAFFHLLVHALFKALLFMCAGNVIHNLMNCQDIRYMGGLSMKMPLTFVFLHISNMALCGLPFLSGFYSKDLIVEFMSMNYLNLYIYLIFYISIGLTVCYSFRLVYYTCIGSMNFISLNCISEKSYTMLQSMGGLIILVIIMGSLLGWLMFSTPYIIILSLKMKIMTLCMILIGIVVGLEVSKMSLYYSSLGLNMVNMVFFTSLMWNMPILSTLGMNFYLIKNGGVYFKLMDQGWLEFYGAQKFYLKLEESSIFYKFLFNNNIKMFFMLIIFWLIFLMVI